MNRHLTILTTAVFIILFATSHLAKANNTDNTDNSFVMISVIKIDEAKVDEAIDLLSKLQLATFDNEEGCMMFDVMIGDDDPTKAFIYESYDGEASYNKHINSKHYIELFTKKLKPMLKDISTTKVFLLNFQDGYSDEEI